MSAASTLPPAEPRQPPTLSTLPPELKLRLMELVDEVDEQEELEDEEGDELEEVEVEEEDAEDEREEVGGKEDQAPAHVHVHGEECGHAHGHGEEDAYRPSSMANLSLASTEFAQLAQPFLWKHVDFTDRPTDQVYHFIDTILPRHARHVQGLTFSQNDYRPDHVAPEERHTLCTPDEELCAKAEAYAGVSSEGRTLAWRQSRARALFFATVLGQLPHLDTLDFDLHHTHSFDEDAPPFEEDLVLDAARRLGDRIIDLTLSNEPESVRSEREMAEVLGSFPNLLRLDLGLTLTAAGRDELHAQLSGMEKLETLSLYAAPYVTDELAEREWRAPLKILALAGCEDLSLAGWRRFVERFAPTLEVLDLDDVPHNNNDKENERLVGLPLDLPQLDTLVLTTLHSAAFLDSFAHLHVHELELGFCPNIGYEAIERFVRLHAGAGGLRQVTVQDAAGLGLTEGQVEGLEVLCFAKGVECKVEWGDEESEESEGSEGDGWSEEEEEESE